MATNSTDIVTSYHSSQYLLKTIVQILALYAERLKPETIIKILNQPDLNSGEQKLHHKSVDPLLRELERTGAVEINIKGVACYQPLQTEAFNDAVLNGRFEKILSALKAVVSLPGTDKGTCRFRKIEELYRAVKIAVFSQNASVDLDTLNHSGELSFPIEYGLDSPWLTLFNRPFPKKMFDTLPPGKSIEALSHVVSHGDYFLEPVNDLLEYCLDLLKKERNSSDIYVLVKSLLLRGRIDDFTAIVKHFDDSHRSQYQMMAAWMEIISSNGTDNASLALFDKALDTMKKETGQKKVFFPGQPGLFFLFALLKSKKAKDHKQALAYIDIAVKHKIHSSGIMAALRPFFQERLGLDPQWHNDFNDDLLAMPFYDNFFKHLVLVWSDENRARQNVSSLERLKDCAIGAGNMWLEAETSALLAQLGVKKADNRKSAKALHNTMGTKTITDIVKPAPQWEKKLNALIRINETNKAAAPSSADTSERLIWLLTYDDLFNTCYVAPRMQKRTKKGSWSKGRPVALKRLYHHCHGMEMLTHQDRMACTAIEENYHHSGARRGYPQIEYDFNEKEVLNALVGHPLLFLDGYLESPVELVSGEPEVNVLKQGEKITVSIHPDPFKNQDDVFVVRETPSRFKLVRYSIKQSEIAGIIGKDGLFLPEKESEKAVKAVSSLASLITVNSDLHGSGKLQARQQKADPAIHAHITPWQDGISTEFLVRPFATAGSYFKPGRGGANVFAEIQGKKVHTQRDLDREISLFKDVIAKCPSLDRIEAVEDQWQVNDPEEALELLFELKNCGDHLILEWPRGEKLKIRSQVSFNNLHISVKKHREWFKATGKVTVDANTTMELTRLLELLDSAQGRFVPLDDSSFLAIASSLKKRLEELKAYSSPGKTGVSLHPMAALAVEELFDQSGSFTGDKTWKEHTGRLKEVVHPEIPGTLQATLRGYQKSGFQWLARLSHWGMGACLADDMGLGKTVQALAAVLLHAGKGPTLVIAPLSVTANWENECRRFAPTLNPKVFGPGDRDAFLDSLIPFDLVISSYGLLQVEGERLAGVEWQTVVLDEAQAIKNMKTKRSKAAMKLNAQFKIITTGTPLENHLDELWTLFNFINPGLLGGFKHFKETFVSPVEQNQDRAAMGRLRKLIRPFILRRLKTDVLTELPEKTDITLKVDMRGEEAALYEAQRLKSLETIENAGEHPGGKHMQILAELTRLRQICCNPALVLPDAGMESSKLKLFDQVIGELIENQHKVLVFSQFVGHLTLLKQLLEKRKISFQYLDGATPAKTRQERIKAFQNGSGEIFLISLKAGGTGLNLTAADYVIHMDPWWNPAIEDQASDRAHRIGQSRPVTVYRLVVRNTIEEKIVALHQEKRQLAQALLSGSDTAGRISAEDLMELLRQSDN
ncbi:MAG: DEAD/DEAH box helicase [Desulfobacteraceae bacterium]